MYVDWYFTTGNHDWDDGNGTAQIAYSNVLKSKILIILYTGSLYNLFNLNNLYYILTFEKAQFLIDGLSQLFIMLSTTLLLTVHR